MMWIQIVKVIISALISVLSIFLFIKFKGHNRKWVMIGMILSTCGDVFMTDIVNLGELSTYFGAGFFILAHIIYAYCFISASRKNEYKFFNKGFVTGLSLVILTAILLTIFRLHKAGSLQGMYFPLLAYLAFIGLNLVSQFSYATNKKGITLFLTLGMTLFLISDFLVFLPMIDFVIADDLYNIVIWLLYIPAQLLIVLFNSEFKIENDETMI